MAQRWRGVLMVEGRPTGDGRYVEPAAIRWENLPLPLTWCREGGGHEGRIVVGSIEKITRDGELLRGEGVLLSGVVPEVEMLVPLITERLVGLSVELDDETSVLQPVDADGNPVGDPEEEPLGILLAADKPPGNMPEDIPAEDECPEGQHPDPITGECVPDAEEPAADTAAPELQYRVQDARIRNAAIVDTPAFIECVIELAEDVSLDDPGIVAALVAGLRLGATPPALLTPTVNSVLTAGAVGSHSTATDDGAWDGPANEAKLTAPMTLATVKAAYAWYDPTGADADGLYPKSACKFIHHLVGDSPGAASTKACSTGIGVLHGGRGGTTIPDGDVQGVYNHLAGHLRSAGQEPPELSAILTGAYCDACAAGKPCDVTRTYTIPDAVAAEARQFKSWHRAGRQGGTAAQSIRADALARGGELSYAQMRRLYLSLQRLEAHAGDVGWEAGDPGYPTPGRVAWAAGGGADGWQWARSVIEAVEGPVETYEAMTAAATAPPAAWFRDPQLQGPTPWTVTDDGRVFGHLALWDTCHVGIAGQCVTPPRSQRGYRDFHQSGPFRLDDGTTIRAGKVTFGTNHADRSLSAFSTVEHYEHTGHVAADVVAGEDRWGIWVAGQLRPGLSDVERLAVQRASVSGDWRARELMAVLAVNNPGFPVVENLVAGGQQQSLIMAGTVEAELRARSRTATRHDPRLEAAAEALAATIGRDRRSLVAAMTAEVHG